MAANRKHSGHKHGGGRKKGSHISAAARARESKRLKGKKHPHKGAHVKHKPHHAHRRKGLKHPHKGSHKPRRKRATHHARHTTRRTGRHRTGRR